ncbi:MAG TPA: penicillin-binding protein, partial [Dielma fastidiosa]|nr:penicillin-binding protein [Dielma fastidiosa]
MLMSFISWRIKMENNNNIKKGSKGVKVLNSIIIVILSLVLIGSVSAFYLLDGILNDPDAPKYDASSLETQESSVIYDTDGNVIIELSREDGTRENVSYDQIPQVVVDAFLSIEDSRFYKHNGFDLPRFIKSALENVKQGNLGQGGSTLTMQMIDVSHMSKLEKAPNGFVRIARKVQEIFLSMQAESHISKQQILEKYLNLINFGGPARGIQKGAQYYFGKDVSQVTLSEAAFLAGVINAPNGFDPYYNYDAAIERRNET